VAGDVLQPDAPRQFAGGGFVALARIRQQVAFQP